MDETYSKYTTTRVRASVLQTMLSLQTSLAQTGFSLRPGASDGDGDLVTLIAEREGRFPAVPVRMVWRVSVENDGARETEVGIDHGLRATLGTWLYFGAGLGLLVGFLVLEAVVAMPYGAAGAIAVLLALLAAVIAMKIDHDRTEKQLWRHMSEKVTVGGRSEVWSAVE